METVAIKNKNNGWKRVYVCVCVCVRACVCARARARVCVLLMEDIGNRVRYFKIIIAYILFSKWHFSHSLEKYCQVILTFFSCHPSSLSPSPFFSKNVRPAQKCRKQREEQRYGHEQWRPKKRLSWYQIEHLKTLHRELPKENSIEQLADKFGISYHAVRRILKSKFEPSPDVQERQDRQAMRQKQERQSKWRTKEGSRKQNR